MNIESPQDLPIKQLYQERLKEKILINPIRNEVNINIVWEKLKTNVRDAAYETLRHME